MIAPLQPREGRYHEPLHRFQNRRGRHRHGRPRCRIGGAGALRRPIFDRYSGPSGVRRVFTSVHLADTGVRPATTRPFALDGLCVRTPWAVVRIRVRARACLATCRVATTPLAASSPWMGSPCLLRRRSGLSATRAVAAVTSSYTCMNVLHVKDWDSCISSIKAI